MKTAVEWLVEELWICKKTKSNWKILENKAKEMEKEQIKDAFNNGYQARANPKKYYKETFKSE